MLSFATEFPVKETSPEQFVGAVKAWIVGSPHTKFSADQIAGIPSNGRWTAEAGTQRIEGLFSCAGPTQTAAFRHVAVDGPIEWVTEVVYSKSESDDWIGVRTSRESDRPQLNLPPAKKPLLVRTFISALGGGLDDELYVSDKPHFFREQDTRMAIRLLNGDADNYLPIVYVSCPFPGEVTVNAVPLARVLGGLAHVVVEPSRNFSRSIQRDVGSRNVYGGVVGVYWPSGERYRYFVDGLVGSEFDVRQALVADIRQSLLHRRPLARCTWARAEAEVARSVFEALRSAGSENVEDYVAAFDSEIAAKDKQLKEADNEIARLNAKIRSQDGQQANSSGLDFGEEQEFHKDEFAEILMDALASAAANAQDGGRRQHVLLAAAGGLPNSSIMKAKRERIKETLKGFTSMTSAIRLELENLGFTISENGKHHKAVYMNDDRYTFALPKSGSDWRGGMNSASDISKRVF